MLSPEFSIGVLLLPPGLYLLLAGVSPRRPALRLPVALGLGLLTLGYLGWRWTATLPPLAVTFPAAWQWACCAATRSFRAPP